MANPFRFQSSSSSVQIRTLGGSALHGATSDSNGAAAGTIRKTTRVGGGCGSKIPVQLAGKGRTHPRK
jgi:hypothetical protein